MRKKTFINRVQALSTEKKLLTVVSLMALISCFMPWYGINSRVINEWWNAFGSIGSVAGYVVFSFSLLALAIAFAPAIKPGLNIAKKLPIKENALVTFLHAQSFFVTLLFIPVYSQYSLINATNSGTRFGIYVALVSTLIGTIVALSAYKKEERSDLRTQEFATVPRAHKAIQDWSDVETEEPLEMDNSEELEQESIFEPEAEPAAHQYVQQDYEESSAFEEKSDNRWS